MSSPENPVAPKLSLKSAGGVVLGPDGRVVVVSQRGMGWSLPKGHVDPGEDDLTAAKREIREESGVSELELKGEFEPFEREKPIVLEDGSPGIEHKTLKFFLFTTPQTKLAPQDPDNPEARWVDKQDVANMLWHDADKRFFRSILHRL